jgi:hypothetical protein
MKHRWLFWSWNVLLVILILVVIIIDLTVYNHFISPQSIFEDKLKVLTALGQFTSIAIAAIAISYQVQATKEREIQFRIHQQRKETYEEFLKMMENISKMTKEKDPDISGKIETDLRKLRPKLIVYASPKVIDIYTLIIKAGLEKKGDNITTAKRMAELYRHIRSEVGFSEEDVPTRQLLSLFITDIYESQYNVIFDKDGYLK